MVFDANLPKKRKSWYYLKKKKKKKKSWYKIPNKGETSKKAKKNYMERSKGIYI